MDLTDIPMLQVAIETLRQHEQAVHRSYLTGIKILDGSCEFDGIGKHEGHILHILCLEGMNLSIEVDRVRKHVLHRLDIGRIPFVQVLREGKGSVKQKPHFCNLGRIPGF